MEPKKPQPVALSVASAASLLADRLGGRPDHWVLWLKNDRRPGRANRIPVEPGPGRPRYALHNLEAYVLQERTARPVLQVDPAAQDASTPRLLTLATVMNDAELQQEMGDGRVEGAPADFVGFEVLAGEDRNGQPTIWVRNGLRGGMHYAIPLPLSQEELMERTA